MPYKLPTELQEAELCRQALGLALTEFRLHKNVPCAIFARSVGIKYPNYWQYEHGKVMPSLHLLIRIIAGLGCDETTFFARVWHHIEQERKKS